MPKINTCFFNIYLEVRSQYHQKKKKKIHVFAYLLAKMGQTKQTRRVCTNSTEQTDHMIAEIAPAFLFSAQNVRLWDLQAASLPCLLCKVFRVGSLSSVSSVWVATMWEAKKTHESLSFILRQCLDYSICTPISQKWEVLLGTNPMRKGTENGQQCHTQTDEWKEEVCETWWYVWDYFTDHFYYVKYFTLAAECSSPYAALCILKHRGKWSYDKYFRGCIYLYLLVAQEHVKWDWMSSGVHFIWTMQPCYDNAADLTARTDCQSRAVSHMHLPRIISQWLPLTD